MIEDCIFIYIYIYMCVMPSLWIGICDGRRTPDLKYSRAFCYGEKIQLLIHELAFVIVS